MTAQLDLNAEADAGGAVSTAWQQEQCRPRVPMELPAEVVPPQPHLPGWERPEA